MVGEVSWSRDLQGCRDQQRTLGIGLGVSSGECTREDHDTSILFFF